jgi:hypothetical protein
MAGPGHPDVCRFVLQYSALYFAVPQEGKKATPPQKKRREIERDKNKQRGKNSFPTGWLLASSGLWELLFAIKADLKVGRCTLCAALCLGNILAGKKPGYQPCYQESEVFFWNREWSWFHGPLAICHH